MLTGARITFPGPSTENNDTGKDLVFRARQASVSHQIRPAALAGGSSVIGAIGEFANQVNIDAGGNRQQLRVDTGGGRHVTQIRLVNWEGSSDRWGANDSSKWDAGGGSPIYQLQTLDNALRQVRVDSINSIKLEVGEYSDGGEFSALNVAPLEPALDFEVREETTTFSADIDFVDVADITNPIDVNLRDAK